VTASRYGNPFGWTGQRYDAGVGLYAFLFRTYSPELGRWLQRDPAGFVDGVNVYEYCRSWPMSWVDPMGADGRPGNRGGQGKGERNREGGKGPAAMDDTATVEEVKRELEEAEKALEKARKSGNRTATRKAQKVVNDKKTRLDAVKQRDNARKKAKSKKGPGSALLLALILEHEDALETFADSSSPCGKWYEAGLRLDHEAMEKFTEECYLYLVEKGLSAAALNFHENAGRIIAGVAELARKKAAEEAGKGKPREEETPGCGKKESPPPPPPSEVSRKPEELSDVPPPPDMGTLINPLPPDTKVVIPR